MNPVNHDRRIIDKESLSSALDELCDASELMKAMRERYGDPPAWRREPGFSSLVYTILEQQVSLASARAVYERLVALAGELTPSRFNEIDDASLRAIGFSRQKTQYCRDIADRVESGRLDLDSLAEAPDAAVHETLTSIRGIGPWTAGIYLLHSLGRPDIWPTGDLALRVAVGEELELPDRPDEAAVQQVGEAYRPWRSVAARLFWHGYLTRRGIGEVT